MNRPFDPKSEGGNVRQEPPRNDNQTRAVGEVQPLANGSDVIHRLMYLWATKRPAGKVNGFEIYSITTTGSDLSAIAEAGDRIIALEKVIASQLREIERLRAENFTLAAGQCVSATADEGGRLYCKEVIELRAKLTESALQYLAASTQLHEAYEDAERYRWIKHQEPFRLKAYPGSLVSLTWHSGYSPDEVDELIDIARKAKPAPATP